MKKSSFFALLCCAFALVAPRSFGQTLDFLKIRIMPELSLPVLGSEDLFKLGGGASLAMDFDILPFVSPSLEAGYQLYPTYADKPMNVSSVGAGLVLSVFPTTRLGVSLGGIGGLYQLSYDAQTVSNWFAKARAELSFRFSPSFNLSASASYSQFFNRDDALYRGLGFGLTGALELSGFRGGTNVSVDGVAFDPIFPIFYSHYDKNKIGTLKLENKESGSIQNVRVSLFIKQFMDQPKLCAVFPTLRRGEKVDVPVFALFNDQVLKLTESSKTAVEIIVDYTFIDSPRQAKISETLRINHRNAMTWDDDRKAAAFVSSKDPAVLRYSKYAAGVIREVGQAEINQNLRFAMGLFEGLKLYGLNYVIDPTTPYKELSQNKNALDFLQFPNQTLTYKGGDCDDLSILFCSILESVGIKTAFITVPGHIYMAFSLDMEEEEARKTFFSSADLLFIDKKAWVPVEITLLNDGFLKAWQIGAKEWFDNAKAGKAGFIPIQDAWAQFEPVGIPGEDTRIVLPPPDQLLAAYNGALGKFISREIQPQAEMIKAEILSSGSNPRQINRLGVLYARYGLLNEARAEFEKASRLSYAPSLTNLGNIAYLQKKFLEAVGYFQRALGLKTDNKIALIGLARSQYEMENYAEADRAYAQVQKTDPALAGQYAYLVSRTEGAARASSASERAGRAAWSEE